MMTTLKQGLALHLMQIREVAEMVGDKVYSKRIIAEERNAPYIVYALEGYKNKLQGFQGKHGYRGRKFVLDLVWEYEQEDDLRALLDTIIAKLVGSGNFGGWIGSISLEFVDEGYDEKTDFSVFRAGFLAKETF